MELSSLIPDGQRSAAGRLTQGAGLALVIVGLAQASGFFQVILGPDALEPGIFRPLMLAIALILSFLGVLAAGGDDNRPFGAGLFLGGLGLLAGLAGLWQVGASIDHAQATISGHVDPWIAVLGIGAVIVYIWRHGSKALAYAAIAALFFAVVWHAVTWRPGSPEAIPVEVVPDIARSFWFDFDDGILGRVLDVMLSSVFPLFILCSILVSHISPGEAMASVRPVGRLGAALQAICQYLIPTLAIGSLFMMTRPGIDLLTIALAWVPMLGIGLACFWRTLLSKSETTAPNPVGWHDAFSVGAVLATLISALVSGFSLQLSTITALGVVITMSFVDAYVRRRPNIILLRLAQSGIAFAGMLIAAGAVGLILAVLDRTGLPIDVARLLAGAAGEASFPLVILAVIAAIAMGLVMPGFAAYLIVAAVFGPSLRTVGVADSVAHLLILAASAAAVAIACVARSKTA